MPKHDFDYMGKMQYSVISEEKSFDEIQTWVKKQDEIEKIQSLYGQEEGNFTITEEPSESTLGSFRVRIGPNCGMEIKGCFVELEMNYLDLDSAEMYIEVLPEQSEGLTED